jgi:exopolysaccharide biosynthesis protein
LVVALADEAILAVAADGRGPDDAGLTLWELADLLVDVGATSALHLDGGAAGVIVSDGGRVNTPRDREGAEMEKASPSVTAVLFG